MKTSRITGAVLSLTLATVLPAAAETAWIERSNGYAQQALELFTKYSPEGAASLGIEGYDDQIMDLKPGYNERARGDMLAVAARLEQALATETHPKVKQDLEIIIKALKDNVVSSDLEDAHMLPYFNLAQSVFFGTQSLLDPQTAESRRPALVARLRKYSGIQEGYTPIVELAKGHIQEGLKNPELLGPFVAELDQHLQNKDRFVEGMRGLLAQSTLEGWQEPFEAFAAQLNDYYAWLDGNVRPRARQTPQLPPEMYADNLKNFGVDVAPEELIERATLAFANLQGEMQALAQLVAEEKGYDAKDYREVIARLKEERIPGDEVLAFYKATLKEIEQVIVREQLVSLPEREAGIEIADEARSAAQPAPHLKPPRLIGNTGEYPIFMIPTIGKNEDGTWKHNDTTFKANAWTLTAHEARPGHEMQFSSMVESGVSTARGIFAFNSANVEGWALYAEAITRPYMPLDAQLISLQNRLLRAARMFLDPMLNLGQITRDEAKDVLMRDVVIDDGFAQQEIDRYSFRAPGQATSYYFGYSHLQSLRTLVELKLEDRFDQKAYHDFLLAQGLLPPSVLRQAVMEEFVAPLLTEVAAAD